MRFQQKNIIEERIRKARVQEIQVAQTFFQLLINKYTYINSCAGYIYALYIFEFIYIDFLMLNNEVGFPKISRSLNNIH